PGSLTPRSSFQFSQTNKLVGEAVNTKIMIDRWRLQWLCHELKEESKAPKFRDAWPWFIAFGAFIFVVVPGDLKDFLGVSAGTWEAFAMMAALLTGMAGVVTLCK